MVLDKTGTGTAGEMALVDVHVTNGGSREDALRMVGALEVASEHPIARAIASAAAEDSAPLPPVEDFANVEGLGVTGMVEGRALVAGRAGLLAERGLSAPDGLASAMSDAEEGGRTAVVAGWDGKARVVLVVADTVKPTSEEAVRGVAGAGSAPGAAHR